MGEERLDGEKRKVTELERQWIAAWRLAGPRLQEIRDRELRELDESAGMKMLGANHTTPAENNGLAIFQSWMMRLRVKELQRELESR